MTRNPPVMGSHTAAAMQSATRRAFGAAAVHMHRPGYQGPLCGQVNATGKGWARTHYTTDPATATCKKCRKALDKLDKKATP